MSVLFFVSILLFAYLFGAIPFGYLIGKWRGVDVRDKGSGNIGMTNVWRILGWKAGISVFILDFSKGFLLIFSVTHFVPTKIMPLPLDWIQILLGFVAICGHNWTIFLNFKGGKGVATATGVFCALAPIALAIAALFFFALVIPTRYISLGSIFAATGLPIIIALQIFIFPSELLCPSILTLYLAIFISIFVIYKHRSNIRRLLQGNENRFGSPKV